MEEEKDDNKQHKTVKSIGDSWIICRSETHSGRVYYFNTLTGKAVWNLSDAEMKKAQLHTFTMQAQSGTNIENCPEPTEPPVDILTTQQPRGSRIYNKQIINNQFTKPYAVAPYVNPQYYNSLNNMTNMSNVPAVFNPNMWSIPPPQPVFLAPVVNPFANQPLFNNLVHQPPQNVDLSNTFPVMNDQYQLNINNAPNRSVTARLDHRFVRNFQSNATHDLRNVLSARRKVLVGNEDERFQETCNVNRHDEASITEDDLYASDIDDEWLQAYTGDDKSKLNLNVSSVWGLACGKQHTDCWFIVVSTMVLLNHMKFLTSLVNSDGGVRVVSPPAVRARMRLAAGAGAAPAERARRAARFAAKQMNRVPSDVISCKGNSIMHCCMELVQRNYFVIHLTTEEELQKSNMELQSMTDVSIFTVGGLKDYLTQNSYAPTTEFHRNITVTVFPDDAYEETQPKVDTPDTLTNDSNIGTAEPQTKTKEVAKFEDNKPKAKTVNAEVQTDLSLEPLTSSPSLNAPETLQFNNSFDMDTELPTNSNRDSNTKKIKLKRSQSVKKDDTAKTPTFKWRKRRLTAPTNLKEDERSSESNDVTKQSSCSPLSFNLLYQQSDNAVDYDKSMEVIKDGHDSKENTSDVISNSVDSDSMFKLNQKAITSDPQYYEKDIVMFEVTGDQMDDYLSKGCEEWLSRFVQIMEEALSQILQQKPSFVDVTLPPPWTIHEATVCVKKKFEHNSIVSFACVKLLTLLHKISDGKGKIYQNLDPSSFMQMYSYGVNLIEALQSELQDSEDIQIAMESLNKLLYDIRNPNMDASHNVFADAFNYEDGKVADCGDTGRDDGYNTISRVEAEKESPRKKLRVSDGGSPSKYNLRSAEKKKTALSPKPDKESSFFTVLGLAKNIQMDGPAINISFNSQLVPPREPDLSSNQAKPTIIRNFKKCLEYEQKLKENLRLNEEFAEDNLCSGSEFYLEDWDGDSSKSGDVDASLVLRWVVARTTCPVYRVLKQTQQFCKDTKEQLKHKDKLQEEYKTNLFEKSAKLNTHLDNLCTYLNGILHHDTKSKFREIMQHLQIDESTVDDSQVADYRQLIGKFLTQAGIFLECVNIIRAEIQT